MYKNFSYTSTTKILLGLVLLVLSAPVRSLAQTAEQKAARDTATGIKDSTQWNQLIRLPWEHTAEKKYYAGAISSISGDEMARFRVANNSNMVAGRLAGLITTMGSEIPGYDGSSLSIRGFNSYNNSAASTFVDNIPVSFSQLDPLEIDQFSVLKDATANASFGMNSGNKALFVTTKRGTPGQNKINFYSQVGVLQPTDKVPYLGAQQYMQLYNEAATNDGLPARFTQEQIDAYNDPNRDIYKYPDVNWYDELVKKSALQQKYNLTFSGGSDFVRYFVLLGYMNQAGLLKYTNTNEEKYGFSTSPDFKRYNFRSNLDFKITDNLIVALDLSGRVEDKNFPGASSFGSGSIVANIFDNISKYPPNAFPMLYPDGKIGGNSQFQRSPYGLITNTGFTKELYRNLLGTTRVTQKLDKLVNGLSATAAFSYYNYFRNTEGRTMNFAVYEQNPTTGAFQTYGTDQPYATRGRELNQERMNLFWGKLDYSRSFNEKHELVSHLGFYQSVLTPDGDDYPYADQSFFGRAYYAYNKKYIAEFNASYAGSENLPKGERFGFFPSFGAAWMLSEENFLKANEKISLLKLRASYGLLGNSDFGIGGSSRQRYLFINSYQGGNSYVFGQTPASRAGRQESPLGNPDITWEKVRMANLGMDAAFFNNALSLSLDFFNEKRTNILAFPNSIPAQSGISTKPFNVGSMKNTGLDGEIGYSKRTGDIQFGVRLLGTLAKNTILFQDEVVRPNDYLYRTGRALGTPFGMEVLGFFKDEADITNSPRQQFGVVQPGDFKFKDQNQDGIVDQYDEIALGKPLTPQFYYGSILDFGYKGFDITVWFQGTGDRSVNILSPATAGFGAFATTTSLPSKPSEFVLGRWTAATAETADYPRLSVGSNPNNFRTSSYWTRNGKYLRLKNIELGYNITAPFLSKIKLSGARFYVGGFNVLTWSKLPDYIDPEFAGAGIISYPRLRSFHTGLNLEF